MAMAGHLHASRVSHPAPRQHSAGPAEREERFAPAAPPRAAGAAPGESPLARADRLGHRLADLRVRAGEEAAPRSAGGAALPASGGVIQRCAKCGDPSCAHGERCDPIGSLPRDVWENIFLQGRSQGLTAEDVGRLSLTSKTAYQAFNPLSTQLLTQQIVGPPSRGAAPKTTRSSKHVGHVDTSDNDRSRKQLEHLSDRRQIVTRALNKEDAKNIVKGQPLKAKGRGLDIAAHVTQRNRSSGLISASEKLSHAFSEKSGGHVGIFTPRHYQDQDRQHRLYPSLVPPVPLEPAEQREHEQSFIGHDEVLEALHGENESDVQNAVAPREVLFRRQVPLPHVVNLDQGLPQAPVVLSRAAVERRREREEQPAPVDKGVLKQAKRLFDKKEDPDGALAEALARRVPPEVVKKGRKAFEQWLRENKE